MSQFESTTDRWEFNKRIGCKHHWQPTSFELMPGGIAAEGNRCYVVCLKCGAATYIETWWVGYRLESAMDEEWQAEDDEPQWVSSPGAVEIAGP